MISDDLGTEAEQTVAVFGFSYKKDTSDTRDCQPAYIIDRLRRRGVNVKVHDPRVTQKSFDFEMDVQGFSIDQDDENKNENGRKHGTVTFCGENYEEAVTGANAIAIVTEWDCFTKYNYSWLHELMTKSSETASSQGTRLYDFRCFMDLDMVKAAGFSRAFRLGSGFTN